MVKNIYVSFALMSLLACTPRGLYTEKSVGTKSGASENEAAAVDDKLKSACEAKGGYYSKTLGCFD
jgi:hypothetical protein